MKDILDKLVGLYGPSGRETEVARAIADLIRPHVAEVRTDALGSVIATARPAGGPGGAGARRGAAAGAGVGKRVMLCAHLDQAHLIVTEATKEGLLRFSIVGRFEASSLPGQRVTDRAGVTGVVGLEDGTELKDIASGKMVIDIGASSREEALRRAPAGDVFLPASNLLGLGGDRVSSPALDDRAGCAVLLEVARRLKENSGGTKAAKAGAAEVVFVFSVQGAIAPRGARAAAFGVEPDLALVVDVTPAKGLGKSKTQVELGKGPAIRIKESGYVAPPEVRELLERAARAAGVEPQYDLATADEDASDAQAIEVAGSGVLTGVIGVPARYLRTGAAMVSLGDLEAAVRVILEALGQA